MESMRVLRIFEKSKRKSLFSLGAVDMPMYLNAFEDKTAVRKGTEAIEQMFAP